jgi:pimeloyl-ACP methyl ester carboxylesterase
MALPALVLVHGGGLAADSWDLTIDEIRRLAPELTVLWSTCRVGAASPATSAR